MVTYPVVVGIRVPTDDGTSTVTAQDIKELRESLQASLKTYGGSAMGVTKVPEMRKYSEEVGTIFLTIEDEATLKWLRLIVLHLKPEGSSIGPVGGIERYRVTAFIPKEHAEQSVKKVVEIFEKENCISTESWSWTNSKVMSPVPPANNCAIYLHMDEPSFKKVEAKGKNIFLQKEPITFKYCGALNSYKL